MVGLMPKRKRYFKNNKEMVYYLTNVLNETSNSANIDTEDLQFPESGEDFNVKNLED